MDIAGELLEINQALKSPKFGRGTRVQYRNGRLGVITNSRVSILGEGPFGLPVGYGNDHEVRWENGEREWVRGYLLSFASPVLENEHAHSG